MRAGALLLLLVSACGEDAVPLPSATPDLEGVAIARGVVPDPRAAHMTGLYARASDRLCIVTRGEGAARIGAFVDYGDAIGCTGRGTVTRSGDALAIAFGKTCRFDAAFDGARISFPGRLPEGCDALCRGGASLAGLSVARLSDARAEASALRAPSGIPLCAS